MHTNVILLLGLVIILACINKAQRTKPAWSEQLKGWQKLFGPIAVVLTLLILMNPEFLAWGLLGDTAFFDLLVLALSLQMHRLVTGAYHSGVTKLTRALQWAGIPSPGMLYLLAMCMAAIGSAVSMLQRAGASMPGRFDLL